MQWIDAVIAAAYIKIKNPDIRPVGSRVMPIRDTTRRWMSYCLKDFFATHYCGQQR